MSTDSSSSSKQFLDRDTLDSRPTLSEVKNLLDDYHHRLDSLWDYLAIDEKKEQILEISKQLEDDQIWQDAEKVKKLNADKSRLDKVVVVASDLPQSLKDAQDWLDMAQDGISDSNHSEQTDLALDSARQELFLVDQKLSELEFHRMFGHEMDSHNAFLDIQAGSGGTEAQDWAEMLFRMYMRFCDIKGFRTQVREISSGEVAGIKSATIHIEGEYAYGWLRTETGIHRLVRKSPFDSNHKRHTSFAGIFVAPEIDDQIEIEINPADLRVDTFRASGAGGQHVNKTDSAVRITHEPTGTVAQCQDSRSQHANRESAMKQLRAKLYEIEMQKKRAKQQELEESKSDVGWGSQIRSYVLDQSRIKDLRTKHEHNHPQAVLDGDLQGFIEASLKGGF